MEELTTKKSGLQDTPVWLETSQNSMAAKAKNERTKRMKNGIRAAFSGRPAKTLLEADVTSTQMLQVLTSHKLKRRPKV